MKIRPLIFTLALLPLLAGCQSLYFMSGQGKQKAVFTLPKDKRVLVFVDLRQGLTPPPDFAANLGSKISNHLFRYNAANNLVGQDRLTALERDPANFSTMGVADVVRATDADLAIYVDVVTLDISSTSDNTLSQGSCQCLVKVIDSNGVRMWPPTQNSGVLVSADVQPALTDSRSQDQLMTQLEDLLTIRIGRLFHPYNRDDLEMTK